MHTQDYRHSHMERGSVYDETILSSPFDAHMDRWEERHLAEVLARLYPRGIPRYLDFACGTGRITERVAPRAREAYGIDVSESMLNAARRKCPSVKFVCADLTDPASRLGLFDLVTAFRFFGNAQDELRDSALGAIHRHLRPGGHLILNNHRNPRSFLGAWRRVATGVAELDLSHAKLKRLLRRHGFAITRVRAIGFWIFRFKLATAPRLQSPAATRLERLFGHSVFAPYAPDAFVVARKLD